MKKYMTVFLTESSATLEGDNYILTFEQGSHGREFEITIRELADNRFGIQLHMGLLMEVKICCENIYEAIDEARIRANAIGSNMAFISRAKIPLVENYLAYEITEGIIDREFLQYLHNVPLPLERYSVVKFSHLDRIMRLIGRYSDPKGRFRIQRSLAWYRKGASEENIVDKFCNFWFALESLDVPIREKYNLPYEIGHCKDCGFAYRTLAKVGIKHIFKETFTDSEHVWRDARDLRVEVMHSIQDSTLSEAINEATRLTPFIEKALIKAILLLLEIPVEEHDDILNIEPVNAQPAKLIIVGTLHEPNADKLGLEGRHPRVKFSECVIRPELKQGDKLGGTIELINPIFDKGLSNATLTIDSAFILRGENVEPIKIQELLLQ